MGGQYEATKLQFFIATSVFQESRPELWRFKGRAPHAADDFNCHAFGGQAGEREESRNDKTHPLERDASVNFIRNLLELQDQAISSATHCCPKQADSRGQRLVEP
jgi:hypothetical protein